MKCFYHYDQDAVGMCSQCSKAACPLCIRDVEGALYCKGCIALELRAAQQQQKVAAQENAWTVETARRRLKTGRTVFVVGAVIGAGSAVVQTVLLVSLKGFSLHVFPRIAFGCVLGALEIGYIGWAFYWGVPAVWRAICRRLRGGKTVVVLGGVEWLLAAIFTLIAVLCFGELYCLFGGGWSQWRKCKRAAQG